MMDCGLLGTRTPYEIKLVNRKVVSYGRAGAPSGGARPVIIPQPVIIPR
jgi:hypothetical protein